MTAFNRTPFGFIGWGLSWLAQAVLFHQSSYFSHSTTVADWGFVHGGRRAFAANGYNRNPGGYGQCRGGSFGGKSFAGYSGKPSNSGGGFHPFGGGHSQKGFGGGGKSFGGGHSGGGGGHHLFGKHH